LFVNYIGFKNTDIDTVQVNSFAKDGAFKERIDSAFQFFQTPQSDTMVAHIFNVPPNRDYEIVVPATGHRYRISDIHTRRRDCNCGSDWNETSSYLLNDIRYNQYFIELKK
jgi:hypothetical protein